MKSIVELIPLKKGNRFRLDETKTLIIGRTRDLDCSDNRVSRQHTEISLKDDGQFSIKAIHLNPTFYKTKTNQIVRLTKDKEYFLSNDDEFGFLPDEYFFRVAIQTTTTDRSSPSRTTDSNQCQTTTMGTGTMKTNVLIYDEDTDDDSTDVKEQTASSSSSLIKRERCPFGSKCYRTNPIHRQQAIHPGDADWNDEIEVKHKPICPYGDKCTRKNPDHFEETIHPKKTSTQGRSNKRKSGEEEEEEEEDALPNEYDYNDSFIDDENLEDDSLRTDTDDIESDGDVEWKPDKHCRHFDESDDSEIELTKKEAEEFLQSSKKHKRARHDVSSDDD